MRAVVDDRPAASGLFAGVRTTFTALAAPPRLRRWFAVAGNGVVAAVAISVAATGLVATVVLTGCAATTSQQPLPRDRAALVAEVTATETAFAKSMADRDLAAFAAFIAEDAVFINGGNPLRGKAAIVDHWKRFYVAPQAPFAWRPDTVEVDGSGTLAQSIGPVEAPAGTVVARFYSTWRLQAPGVWKIVFDNGYDVCSCAAAKPGP